MARNTPSVSNSTGSLMSAVAIVTLQPAPLNITLQQCCGLSIR